MTSLKDFPKAYPLRVNGENRMIYSTEELKAWKEAFEKEIRQELHVTKLNHEAMARIGNNTLHKFYEGNIEATERVLGDVDKK